MAQSLSERAEAARTVLFQRYDELNALWTEAEQELTKFHIPTGVECEYSHWTGFQEVYTSYAHLGLQKVGGKWRICHGYSDDGCPYVEPWTPITECSAEVRISAAKHLPKLREAVVKSAESFIPKVEKGIEELRQAISQCRDHNLSELLAERAKLNGKAK